MNPEETPSNQPERQSEQADPFKQPPVERQSAGVGGNEVRDAHFELDADKLVSFLRTEFAFPAIDVYIEARFDKVGLLAILEEAGVLPKLEDPNPHDLEFETAAYEQWGAENPDAQEAYYRQLEERQQLLKYLHIGAILGHLAGRHLYPGRRFSR